MIFALFSCSTHREVRPLHDRKKPAASDLESNCDKIKSQIRARDQQFAALRGEGRLETSDGDADVAFGLAHPSYARIELKGVLGVSLGMLLLNDDWLQVYMARDNLAFRIPKEEMDKPESPRRIEFLKSVPFPIDLNQTLDSLLSRSGLAELQKITSCPFDDQEVAYHLSYLDAKNQKIELWVDPQRFAPIRKKVGDLEIVFHQYTGALMASLPSEILFYQRGLKPTKLSFKNAELWETVKAEAFDWRPSASTTVKEY